MNREECQKTVPSAVDLAVHRELISLLFGSPSVPLINGLVALVTAGVLWRIIPRWIMLSWLAASLTLVLARLLLWSLFNKRRPPSGSLDPWAHRFVLATAVTGCVWGLVAATPFVVREPAYYLFAAYVIGGLGAGAAIRLSPHPPAFYVYIGTSVPPMALALFLRGQRVSIAMGGLLLAFIVVMILVGLENNRRLADFIRLKIEQEVLNTSLHQVTVDLTERQKILEEAQRLAHIGNWSFDLRTGVSTWSDELFRIFARDPALPPPAPAEFEGLLTRDSFAKVTQAVQSCMTGGPPFELDVELSLPSSSVGWVSMRGEVERAPTGEPVLVRGTSQDITARKIADALAREQESMFRSLVEQNMSAIFIVVEDGTIAYLNPAALRMFGFPHEGLAIGRPALAIVDPPDKTHAEADFAALLSGRESAIERSVTVRRVDGNPIDVLAKAATASFKGRPAIITVLMDITERRRAENQILKLNTQMAETLAALRRRESELTAVARLSDRLQSCRTVSDAYPIVVEMGAALFPQMSGSLSRMSAATPELVRVAAWGPEQFWSLPAFHEAECRALLTGLEFESEGSAPASHCQHLMAHRGNSSLCLPLKVQDKTRGLLSLVLAHGAVFDDATRQAIHSFADVVKLSLANLQLRDSLAEQASRDPLTGLFNRRYLMETLPREIRRAQRTGGPLTIAMLDIDHFKHFNDLYGHDAGDRVLTELASQFAGALRADDVACRYGGEEFLFLLPGCSLAAALQRMACISLQSRSKTLLHRGKSLPGTTFSVGLASLSESLSTSESLIAAADKAMYVAKRLGRDRMECFEASPSDAPSEAGPGN